ncbi:MULTISPECIES: NAD(P)-dependent oxidoreductase [unclassified Dyella]|uniref:NAD(P)-dependent oxidoreductase n=1 Tax=unclassified Dyella TaxID=2634549 RepID=UPI003F91D45E
MTEKTTIAVLGLGAMGHAFASNLLKHDFPTRVWNRSRVRAESLSGAQIADTPREAAKGAGVVITMLPDGTITESVLLGEHGALASLPKGAVIAQMGTIGVGSTMHLARAIHSIRPDITFIDAPVSGTKGPAEQGKIRILASGDRASASAIEPAFSAIGSHTQWLGEVGAGSRMKLVVNAWLITMMQGIAEATRLAEMLGFTTDEFWSALEGGPLGPPYAKVKLDMIKDGRFDAQMALAWGVKDAGLALDVARDIQMPALERIHQVWSEAVDAGLGELDISAIYRRLGKRA